MTSPSPKKTKKPQSLVGATAAEKTPRKASNHNYTAIPDYLKAEKRWVLWKEKPGKPKPRKVPYYANGKPRKGTLDSAEDVKNLVMFDEARAAAEKRKMYVGFALGKDADGEYWQGVDLDKLSAHPELAAVVDKLPGYVEYSPSGDGVHAIGKGKPFRTAGSNGSGIEFYAGKRFFTVTGNVIRDGGLVDLAPYVETTLRSLHSPKRERTKTEPGSVDNDLRSALMAIPADCDYATWRDCLFALHHETNGSEEGRLLAHEWSAQASDRYDESAKKTIDGIWKPDRQVPDGEVITEATIFHLAKENGWEGAIDSLDNFYAYLPEHKYIYIPTRALWPASSVDGKLERVSVGEDRTIRASQYLDKHRAVQQLVWAPGEPELIEGKYLLDGGWQGDPDAKVFNLYIPPPKVVGDADDIGPYLELMARVYPDDCKWLLDWMAFAAQNPGVKINHAILLGGGQGIGKDTLLEPLKQAVGHWNFCEIAPTALLGRFNGHLKNVVLRISEAHDLGEMDRFKLYEKMKTLTAAPPDVLRVDEKNIREYSISNVVNVVLTTNYKLGGLYLPPDDRRHYVAWSKVRVADYEPNFLEGIWQWYEGGGAANVAAYLLTRDVSQFQAKAPPPKTDAWRQIVDSGVSHEETWMAELIEEIGFPDVLSLSQLLEGADSEQQLWLTDRRNSKTIGYRLEPIGYEKVANPDGGKQRGRWTVGGRKVALYAKADLPRGAQVDAARKFCNTYRAPKGCKAMTGVRRLRR